ncbi:MAG: hypothetical protein L3K13_05195 [Thermoplasmata archaeon]|nr:hypothetical protein [Thermoplasmata archaeon]
MEGSTPAPPTVTNPAGLPRQVIEALRAAGTATRDIHVPPGTYRVAGFATVPSATTLTFDDVRIEMASSAVFLKTLPQTRDVAIRGRLAFVGNGSEFAAVSLNSSTNVSVELDAGVEGLALRHAFVTIDRCSGVKVGGTLGSRDSRLVAVSDSSGIEVSGVRAGPYSTDPGDGVVRVLSTGRFGVSKGVNIHDITVDGGNVLRTSGVVSVSANLGTPDILDVAVSRCAIRNTAGPVDAVDANRCQNVVVSDVSAENVNVGVAVIASHARVSRVQGARCRAQALAFGDPTWQSEDIADLLAEDVTALDCGSGFGSVAGAGVSVLHSPTTETRDVTLRRLVSTDSGARLQKYGLGIGPRAKNVLVESSRLAGVLGPMLNLAGPDQVKVRP